MSTASILINVSAFNSIPTPSTASMQVTSGQSIVSVDSNNKITTTCSDGLSLTFTINAPYVFVGISFENQAGTSTGSNEFPSAKIDRSAQGSSLVVDDANLSTDLKQNYIYKILIQNTAGAIGIIDPVVVNDGEE